MQRDTLLFQRDFAAAIASPMSGPMAVYRNTVLSAAVESLRANYPVVEQLVGEEMFEAVAVDFATACPPRGPIMTLYGERFVDWLEAQGWVRDLPYLPDVARVERLRTESIMAADAEPLAAGEFAGWTDAEIDVALHPSTRFSWLTSPGMSIWLAHQRDMPPVLDLDWMAEGALFFRPKPFVLHNLRIGAAAHRMLFGIRLREPLEKAISTAGELYPEADCAALFNSLLQLGVFVARHKKGT